MCGLQRCAGFETAALVSSSRSPSPRPLPLGEGATTTALLQPDACRTFEPRRAVPLSQRERDGVRESGPFRRQLPFNAKPQSRRDARENSPLNLLLLCVLAPLRLGVKSEPSPVGCHPFTPQSASAPQSPRSVSRRGTSCAGCSAARGRRHFPRVAFPRAFHTGGR